MADDLLKTKLFIPPARGGLVGRPRLLQKLDGSLQGGQKLTLVSAPPGFGKSTLVIDWIAGLRNEKSPNARSAAQNPKFCWLSLDDSDSDPIHFWRYLIAALQTTRPELGGAALVALQSPQPPSLLALAATLINDLAGLPAPLGLVLDDYHLIDASAIHESLSYFLDHCPPQFHLVITTRADPPLQLARRRGRGELTEIRAADLRFTPQEMFTFFNESMLLGLAAEDLTALEHRTEGWIVGMQMAALSLQGIYDKHSMVAAFSGDDRYIADYLVEEVLNRQPEAIQRFLLKTSVLERLSAPLCAALLGESSSHAQEMLDTLERSNLFLVPLDNRRQWFRYHHLFANLLRHKLEQTEGSGALYDLQVLACRWYEQNGLFQEAVRLALSCTDFESAARILESSGNQMFILGELEELRKWAATIPENILLAHPPLLMQAAWAAHATGYSAEARRFLGLLEKQVGATVESHILVKNRLDELAPVHQAALLESSVLYTRLALDNQGFDFATRLGERVLPYLVKERDHLPRLFNIPSALRSPMIFQLGLAEKIRGNFESASRNFIEAASLAQMPPANFHIIAVSLGHLSDTQILQGRLDEAEETCRKALQIIQEFPVPPSAFFGMSYIGLARVAFEGGGFEQAMETLQKGLELCRLWNFVEGLAPGYCLLVELCHAQGNLEGAQAALEQLNGLDSSSPQVIQALDAARSTLARPLPDVPYAPSKAAILKSKASAAQLEPLSERELEVLALIASGATNADIARKLYVSINTVKKHITNIFGKLGTATRVQAIEKARSIGLIPR
jgi:LuxR family transcriptional regulator, maltose regulon positive regulatory protein